jgi:hypothetical protein
MHILDMVGVVGSNPIARSKFPNIIKALYDRWRLALLEAEVREAWGKRSARIFD